MFLTYNLANTVCYTALAVSFSSLNGFMTTNQKSRGINGGLQMIFNAATTILVSALILNLARAFGGGETYTQRGWTLTVLIFMIAFAVMALIGYFGTRERASDFGSTPAENAEEGTPATNDVSVVTSVVSLLKNKYWLICIVAAMSVNLVMALSGGATMYFTEYVLGDVDIQATLNSVLNLTLIPMCAVSIVLMGKFGKRNIMMLGTLLTIFASLVPMISLTPTVCIISAALKGISYGMSAAPAASLVQDAITYGLWKNGFINVGMGNAANTFAAKIGSSLGTVLIGALLEVSGFVAGAAAQSAGTISMVSTIYIWVPAIFSVISTVCLFFYDLDKFYPQIEADIKEGKFAPGVEAK